MKRKRIELINLLKIIVGVVLATGAMLLLISNYGYALPELAIWAGAYFGGGILASIRKSKPKKRIKRG